MIENEDLIRLKEIFVTRDECNNRMEDINRNIANITTEIALIKQTLDRISWGVKLTLGLLITTLTGAVLKLVLLP